MALSTATRSFHSVFYSVLKTSMSLNSFILSVSLSLSVRFYPSVQSAGWEHGLNLCTGNTGNPMGFKIFLTFLCSALAFEVAPLPTEMWSLWFKGAHFERKRALLKKKNQLSKLRMWNIDALWCLIVVCACVEVLFSWNRTLGRGLHLHIFK